MKHNNEIPTVTNKSLLIASISAVALSLLIYFTVILPAEYNIDPTGVGQKLGLFVLSEPVSETEISQRVSAKKTVPDSFQFRQDKIKVTVPANKGIEYKFNLKEFDNLSYKWKTVDASNIYFDFHGEPEGDTTGYFESYTIATSHLMQGSATMPFTGSHGWYWKNNSNEDITIELETSGNYQVIGLKR